jgi:hypothetical protein
MQTMPLEPLIGPILCNGVFAGSYRTTGPISNLPVHGRKVLWAITVLTSKLLQLIGLEKTTCKVEENPLTG